MYLYEKESPTVCRNFTENRPRIFQTINFFLFLEIFIENMQFTYVHVYLSKQFTL